MKSSNQLSRDLSQAQKKLAEFLGDYMTDYYSLLKSWFKGKLSKHEFDLQARNLISHDSINLHNNFLLTLLTKCGNFDPSMEDTGTEGRMGRVRKRFKKSHNDDGADNDDALISFPDNPTSFQQFIPADPFSNTPQIPNQAIPPKFREFSSKVSLSLLPTQPLNHCRLFVGAWERGLEGVTDECVDLVHQAVMIFVKNIIQALATHKYGFQVHKTYTRDTPICQDTFVHSIGLASPTLSLMPSIPSSLSDLASNASQLDSTDDTLPVGAYIRQESESNKATSVHLPLSHHINLFDFLELLQSHKKVIASSSLCCITEERIIHKLYHPSQQLLDAQHAINNSQ